MTLISSPTGLVLDTDHDIVLEDLPIITPNGDVVVPRLSFKVGRCVSVTSTITITMSRTFQMNSPFQ